MDTTLEATTVDVAVETPEDEQENVCRIMARNGQIVLQLNSQYFVLNPELAGAYGCSMIVFGYLESQGIVATSDGTTEIDANLMADAMTWALSNMQKLTEPSSSIKVSGLRD